MRTFFALVIIPIAFITISATQASADGHITVGDSLSYSQGKYGTRSNIDIVYDEMYIQYQNGNATVKLTVPFESVKGLPIGSTISGGTVVNSKSTQTKDVSGLGDVMLEGGYTLLPASGLRPSITPYCKIKFGTASQSDGLGTGENDYEAGLNLQQMYSQTFFPFASLGYRSIGNPSGYSLKNIWTYKMGATYAVTGANFLSAMVSGTSAQQSGLTGPLDFVVAWNYNTTVSGSGFQVYLDKGLNNTSSNFGIGVAAQYVF